MNLKSKWGMMAGAVLISGAVLTAGIALAESNSSSSAAATSPAPAATQAPTQDRTNWLDEAVKSGKLTQAEADVMKQIDDLRKSAMEKLQADEKAILDQAVKDGKLTQDQADKLSKHPGPNGGGREGRGHGGPGPMGRGRQPMTQEQLKAKLDEEVKAGKLTQAQEDEMLQRFAQRQEEHAQAQQSQQSQKSQSQSTQGQ